MIEQAVDEFAPIVGTRPACAALGVAPATIYRRRRPPEPRVQQPQPPYIRHSSRTGISVVTDAPFGGRAITVFEGSPSPGWNPVRWRPGQ
jgi:hypothetical protein